MVKRKFDVPNKLFGEKVLLQEVYITQGLLLILIGGMFVFISNNLYVKFMEYGLILWYLALWVLKTIRENER